MSKRARAFSASLFNRDRSSSTPPSPASKPAGYESFTSPTHSPPTDSPEPVPPSRRNSRAGLSRPASVIQPLMMSNAQPAVNDDEILPELVRIFRYLTQYGQKLYHEGYFQKLNDLNPDGSSVANREWTDCYAQLLGTVLTIWDSQAIEAEEDRTMQGLPQGKSNVKPTFLNLTDASMKMIGSLPQKANGPPLTNVLSLSTAGRNRYLLHFNNHPELTQWTAAIRLAMFEHNCLQEAYTGALIAAKGRSLNSIGAILERSRFKVEDWTRIRFGAGTPWKRYWTVITPPDEKAFQKYKKAMKKAGKGTGAELQLAPLLGDIKFYETNKVKKKTVPVATINNAFSAYAVYPESKALIDQSTLIKIQGNIVLNSDPPFTSEGIIFMMPDLHPGVSGFEMMLRFLIPTYDVFNLYGRPTRLVADSIDPRSLMFAFPKETSSTYGLLDIIDIVTLINEQGSNNYTEAEWRRKLKQTTSKVQLSGMGHGRRKSLASQSSTSLPTQHKYGSTLSFDENSMGRKSLTSQRPQLPTIQSYGQGPLAQGYPDQSQSALPQLARQLSHSRSISEAGGYQMYASQQGGFLPSPPPPPGQTYGAPPPPPPPPPQGYVSQQPTAYQQQQHQQHQQPQQQPPQQQQEQGYGGYGSHPSSRPPSSKSQRSQQSMNSSYSQQPQQQQGQNTYGGPGAPNAYRQQVQQPQQGPPTAYRGAGGFDPTLGGRAPPPPPQLQTNIGQAYPMPSPSPHSARGPPIPAHAFSAAANAREMSRLSNGTLQMLQANNAGPVNDYYGAQGRSGSPTRGQPPQAYGPGPHRAPSYGSSDTSTDSEISGPSHNHDFAAPRPGYNTQRGFANTNPSSITPNTGAIASHIPKANGIHNDNDDLNLAEELRRKQLNAAAAAAARGPVPYGMQVHTPQPQHPSGPPPVPHKYGGQYGTGPEDGSARSVRGYQ